MKKTLQEEKDRILDISRKVNNVQTITESLLLPHYLGELKIAVENYVEEDKDWMGSRGPEEKREKLLQMVGSFFDTAISRSGGKSDNDVGSPDNFEDSASTGRNQETDEYHNQFNSNMSQGFKMNEDNEFVGAAKKALTEGKDTFKLKGKKYRVTLSKSKK